MFVEHGKQKRAIIDVDLILQLFQNNCQIHLCTGQCSVASFEAVGGVLKITWECSNGHSWGIDIFKGAMQKERTGCLLEYHDDSCCNFYYR